jgi:tRNA threonylcarbamoyladenosine biosynthesis protein TsaE
MFGLRAQRSRRKAMQEAFASHHKRAKMTQSATRVSISLPNEAATRALGAVLAQASSPGAVILLQGPLGAGKTTLVDAFAQARGAGGATSPTFVIAHVYENGGTKIWHIDLYRLDDEAQISDLDLAQYMSADALTLCEWPERTSQTWPADALSVLLSVEGSGRSAVISGSGERWSRLESVLATAFAQK